MAATIPNRRLFEDRLTIALAQARRLRTQLALLYIDVDRLNRINDTLGHTTGDEVLRTIGRRLASCVRASDTLARLGGDEFVLVATNLRHVDDTRHQRYWVEAFNGVVMRMALLSLVLGAVE